MNNIDYRRTQNILQDLKESIIHALYDHLDVIHGVPGEYDRIESIEGNLWNALSEYDKIEEILLEK